MKSVMFSEIVHAHRSSGGRSGLSPLAAYGLTVAIGMPLLVLALSLLDPGAPLAAIVLPVLAGLALPLWAGTPGRFEVSTRFDAVHLRPTLDSALRALGYVEGDAGPGRIRYVKKAQGTWRACTHTVTVRMHAHTIEFIGPVPTLRALHAALSGAAGTPADAPGARTQRTAPPSRETVAGAMQISDNAGRVAGMAE